MRFEDLGLSEEVLQAVADAGYDEPMAIQEVAIPFILQGRDVLGTAQTGTGKTAAFTLPMIDILAAGTAKARMPRSLILTPTRELATQVSENFEIYGKQHKLSMALLIGGVSLGEQEQVLNREVDVLIATPGRLLDLVERGKILMRGVKILVIDEADRMLDMGFIPDVERIVALLPPLRQTLFFSATMPGEIRRLADAFLHNPKEISVDPPTSPAENVSHALAIVAPREKGKALRTFLRGPAVRNALVFCNRKRDVDLLNKTLRRHGFESAALHGDMPQSLRTKTLESFKRGEVRFLVASDVAARGLDIFGLSHVFNYDVPTHAEDYIHRIGRTGRAGHLGRAITLAVAADGKFVDAIARLIGKTIPRILVSSDDGRKAERDIRPAPMQRARDHGHRVPEPKARDHGYRVPEPKARDHGYRVPEPKARDHGHRVPEPKAKRGVRDRSSRNEPADSAVVGMGDHVPAFLLRPVTKGKK